MTKKNEAQKFEPLPNKVMRVSNDGKRVLVGSQTFKRTVLPSAATPSKPTDRETEALLDELDQNE